MAKILILILVLSLASFSSFAATLNVDVNDIGCNDITGTPYCNIDVAVGNANSGDDIVVADGTYLPADAIIFNKSSINLHSVNGAGSTIIDFQNRECRYWYAGTAGIKILYEINNSIIDGFTVTGCNTGSSDSYISIAGSNNTVKNNIIIGESTSTGGQDLGIHLGTGKSTATHPDFPSNNRILNNEVYDVHGSCIFIGNWAGTGNVISNNNLHGCFGGGIFGNGIEIDRAFETTVTNNTMYDNDAGIRFFKMGYNDSTALIDDNNITGNGIGIKLLRFSADYPVNITIIDNDILNNINQGILVESDGLSTGVLVNSNNIAGNNIGVENQDAANDLNASNNWWGSSSGPGGEGSGTGDNVSNNIIYDNWITFDSDGDDFFEDVDDCDDNDFDINPNATEICDGVDNNCDNQTDEGCGGNANGNTGGGSGGGKRTPPIIVEESECGKEWECEEWSECKNEKQTRDCENECGDYLLDVKPCESEVIIEKQEGPVIETENIEETSRGFLDALRKDFDAAVGSATGFLALGRKGDVTKEGVVGLGSMVFIISLIGLLLIYMISLFKK